MASPDVSLLRLAVLLLAGLHLALPWAAGGKSPTGMGGLVVILAFAGAIGLVLEGPRPRLRPSPLLLLAGLLIGISALHSIHPDRTVQSLLLLLSYLLATALAIYAVREVRWAAPVLLWSISISGVLVSLVGLCQILFGTESGFYAGTLTGPFGYPNAAAGFLLLTAGASLAQASEGRPVLRRTALAAAFLSILGFTFARSHGAMLAGAIGLGSWAILDRRTWWPYRWRWAGGGGLAVLLMVGFRPTWLLSLPSRLATLFDPKLTDTSFMWRLHILDWTWAMVRDHPWWGVGPGAFPVALLQYQNLPYVSGVNPHNLYLEVAAEYGFPTALLLVAALAIVLMRAAIKAKRAPKEDPDRSRLAALTGTLIAFGLHSAVDLDWSFPAIALAATTILGVAAAPAASQDLFRPARQPAWRVLLSLFLVVSAVFGLCRYYATTLSTMAESALVVGDVATAKTHLAWALRLNPWSFKAHLTLSRARLRLGDAEGALAIAEKAAAIAPLDPNGHYLVGETAMAARRWDVAVARFRAAVELSPAAQLRFHAGLVESATRAGRFVEARRRYGVAALMFTPERVLDREARCLAPGDRYLLARMIRIVSPLHMVAGEVPRPLIDRATALAQPDPRGICTTRGVPGQTSPEATVQSFWHALSEGGWHSAEQFLTPAARTIGTSEDRDGAWTAWRSTDARVAWIASLDAGERFARLQFETEIDLASNHRLLRCAHADLRLLGDSWFLEYPPRLEAGRCQP